MSRNAVRRGELSREVGHEVACVFSLSPLHTQTMTDPVRASDGFVYERSVVALWMRSHSTSPLSGLLMSPAELIPQACGKKLAVGSEASSNQWQAAGKE